MRRFLCILLCAVAVFAASAQKVWFNATSYAYKAGDGYGNWTAWSDWIPCTVPICIDYTNDQIFIYSAEPQAYQVYDEGETYYDNGGGTQVEFPVFNADGLFGTVRLRIESSGNAQLYVTFRDAMWVYNVSRR